MLTASILVGLLCMFTWYWKSTMFSWIILHRTRVCDMECHTSLSPLLMISLLLFLFSGKLVSPKWKNFKGLKLLWRDKIRLNNAIWRAWYMQCKSYFLSIFIPYNLNVTPRRQISGSLLVCCSTGMPRLCRYEVSHLPKPWPRLVCLGCFVFSPTCFQCW